VTLDAVEPAHLEREEFLKHTAPVLYPVGNDPAGVGLQGGERVQGPDYDRGR
jgi:hypothetical protein